MNREQIRRLLLRRLVEHGGGDEEALSRAQDVDPTTDVAVDSLHMVEIVLELEQDLNISIPHSDLTSHRLRSVNRFTDYLTRKVVQRAAS